MSKLAIALLASSVALVGCGTVERTRDDVGLRTPIAEKMLQTSFVPQERPRVVEVAGSRLSAQEVSYTKNKGAWLKKIPFSFNPGAPVALSQVVAAIAAKGVNVVSDLPIDNVTFTGRINPTDLESALRQILGSSGYDYAIDDESKMVTIKPLSSKTWTLPIRERSSTFSSAGQSATGSGAQQAGGSQQSGGSSSQNASASAQGGAGQQGSNGAQPGGTGGGMGGATGGPSSQTGSFSAIDSPWAKLQKELDDRLTVMVPTARNGASAGGMPNGMPPPMPTPMTINAPGAPSYAPAGSPYPQQGMADTGGGAGELYVKKRVGHYALNPNTGAVTVTAPHWILSSLDPYFRRTADALNTQISVKGIMLLVSKTKSDSEGIDLQNFAAFASGRFGAIISNNNLGGVSVNFGSGSKIPSVTTGNTTLGGPMLGVQSQKDGVAIFNNYMQQFATTYIVEEPSVATTPGVAGKFSNIVTDSYTRLSQTAAAGNTGAAVQGIDNQIVPIRLGTELSVYPTYDPVTGIVRALIVAHSNVQVGTKYLQQYLATGNTAQQVTQPNPITRELHTEGEVLARDGDLIIFGGQRDENMRTNEAGLPGGNAPLGGVLGNKSATRGGGTYYFALKFSINKL